MVFRRKKNKNFRNNQSKSSIIDHSCASLNFLSIYLIVNKAKIPSLVYHHWQFLSMYRSIFSHQRSKNASIIDSILHLSFILHARIDRNNFLSSKRKNSIAKTQSMRQFHPHNTYLSIFFLFLLTKRSTMYIPNSRWWILHAANRGWITLGCDRNRFQGNWYRLRAINNVHASTNRGGIEDIRPGVGQFLDRDYTHVGTICEQHRARIVRDAWAWTVLVFGLVSRSCSISNIVNFLHEHFVELMFLFIGSWSLWGLVEYTRYMVKKWNSKFEVFIIIIIADRKSLLWPMLKPILENRIPLRVFNYFDKSVLFQSYDWNFLNWTKISTTLENKELISTDLPFDSSIVSLKISPSLRLLNTCLDGLTSKEEKEERSTIFR